MQILSQRIQILHRQVDLQKFQGIFQSFAYSTCNSKSENFQSKPTKISKQDIKSELTFDAIRGTFGKITDKNV